VATLDNAAYNDLGGALQVFTPSDLPENAHYEVVVANILANPLIELASELSARVAAGGSLIMAGLLQGQAAAVQAAYPGFNFASPLAYQGSPIAEALSALGEIPGGAAVIVNATDPPPLITECPNCQTRFRVGESQLQIAHGRVRCGACLAVFAGVDHLVLDESAPPPELPSESNGLESVLAELEGPREDPLPQTAPQTGLETDSSAESAADTTADSAANDSEETSDWTAVSVDTQELGFNATQDAVSEPAAKNLERLFPMP